MIQLTNNDWEILFNRDNLSKEQIAEKLGKTANFYELKELYKSLKFEENKLVKFSSIFWDFPKKLSYDEEQDLYRFLIKEEWHEYHEYIVGYFQEPFNNNRENIVYLVYLLENLPAYVANDSALSEPFIRKIIYAIGAQPEPDTILVLEKIIQSEDETIRDFGLHQIEIRKKLGRWEQKIKK
jgi:hypothetical protein